MKTFLKVAALGLIAFLAFHFRNLLLAPLAVALVLGLVFAALLCLALVALLGAGAGLILTVLGVAVAGAIGLAPIWLPALAVFGAIHLYRRRNAKNVTVAAA